MKLKLAIFITLALACARAGEQSREFASARSSYFRSDFRNAAAGFRTLCNGRHDAEACYWAGLSYERLADIRTPFGCRASAKAHEYYSKAMEEAPGVAAYRDALFEFLLNAADCSRTALREAAVMLSKVPESDPSYDDMIQRLQEESRVFASPEALERMFLVIPQAASVSLPGMRP